MTEVLIDTNILVYAHQPAEKAKYTAALRTLEHEAVDQASRFAEALSVLDTTRLIVLEAGRGVRRHAMSYDLALMMSVSS